MSLNTVSTITRFPLPRIKTKSIEITESWPGVRFAEHGIEFTYCSQETWMKVGRWLGDMNGRTKLWIADWIEEGNRRGYGHTYDDLKSITGLEKETLYNYASIGRRVPLANRIAGNKVSWYAAVAALPQHDQRPMLEKAQECGWDRDMLRAAVKEKQGGRLVSDIPLFPFEEEDLTPALGARAHVANNSGNYEWYSPASLVEAARRTMGSIDLDPASCELANSVVNATRYYTKADDGLTQDWQGNIYLNPPYSKKIIDNFIAKLLSSEAEQAVTVVNNGTETDWCQKLMDKASAVCFPRGRIQFWGPDGARAFPLQGQAIFYLGDRPYIFQDEYLSIGVVWLK